MTTVLYSIAAHRTWDKYTAIFLGSTTTISDIELPFTDGLSAAHAAIAALNHGETTLLRLNTTHIRDMDEICVLRYDVPAECDTLHIQYIRWRHRGLSMVASTVQPPPWPAGLNAMKDCVYTTMWTRPSPPSLAPTGTGDPLPAELTA